jgi:hypothetical protein
VQSTAPALGKTDSGADRADRECTVVLRDLQRTFTGNGYEERCTGTVCRWVWVGHVDVSKDAFPQGASVGALYHLVGDATWWEVTASLGEGYRPGYWHYTFEITDHLFGQSLTYEELEATTIEVAPFLRLADGTRVFDHNRHAGDLENYLLTQPLAFAVGDDNRCAPVAGTVFFAEGWDEWVTGGLHANGWLAISYDLDRLGQCRGTHNGYPAWDLIAFAKFLPGGQVVSGSVRDFVTNLGTPTNEAKPRPLEVKIPADATAVELWFQNYSGAGNNCEAWDSNDGQNYRFPIWPDVHDPRCVGYEMWDSRYGGKETCVGYPVAEQYDASHCELWVDGIGDGYEGHYGIPWKWLESYVKVGPQDGEVLGVGQYTRYADLADGQEHDRYSLGTRIDDRTWKTGFTSLATIPQGGAGYERTVRQVAFFVDVRRPSGTVVRLWQSRGGTNYGWSELFGAGTTTQWIPYGRVEWANDGNAVFDARRACQ